MAVEVAPAIQWVPILTTILGACIAFVASFVIVRFTKNKEEKLAKENRDRERIERIYKLLVIINNERSKEMADTLNSIHHAIPVKSMAPPEFPPLIELEMLIKLYFPTLDGARLEFLKAIHEFSPKYLEFRFKDYKERTLQERQKDSSILVGLCTRVDGKAKALQLKLIEHVNA